ncbi:MAG: glycoside hydrolase family 2 protein, partial [bacterium]|nr:glycoside hydrolase family 2 protein [bacterium]
LDYASPGVTVCQRNVTAEAGELSIAARMVNDTHGPLEAVLKAEVFDHTGRSVASAEQAATMAVGLSERTLDLTVVNPELWQGVENPYLYDVRVSLETDGHGADTVDIKTGLRSYAMDPEKGFVLNGQPFRLHGASRHQDRKGVGHAITREHMEEDMRIMLEMGCTSIRLAHYQHDSYYYDLCDRYGLVAWAEIPYVSQTSDTDEEGLNLKQQL